MRFALMRPRLICVQLYGKVDKAFGTALTVNDLATWFLAGAAGVGHGSPTAVPPGTSLTVNADSGPSGQRYSW